MRGSTRWREGAEFSCTSNAIVQASQRALQQPMTAAAALKRELLHTVLTGTVLQASSTPHHAAHVVPPLCFLPTATYRFTPAVAVPSSCAGPMVTLAVVPKSCVLDGQAKQVAGLGPQCMPFACCSTDQAGVAAGACLAGWAVQLLAAGAPLACTKPACLVACFLPAGLCDPCLFAASRPASQVVCTPAKLVLRKTPGLCTPKYDAALSWVGEVRDPS